MLGRHWKHLSHVWLQGAAHAGPGARLLDVRPQAGHHPGSQRADVQPEQAGHTLSMERHGVPAAAACRPSPAAAQVAHHSGTCHAPSPPSCTAAAGTMHTGTCRAPSLLERTLKQPWKRWELPTPGKPPPGGLGARGLASLLAFYGRASGMWAPACPLLSPPPPPPCPSPQRPGRAPAVQRPGIRRGERVGLQQPLAGGWQDPGYHQDHQGGWVDDLEDGEAKC
jgi:hypothetical protein